jgi:uncharacterized protein (DUF488 family)
MSDSEHLYTIGHSTHAIGKLIELLQAHGITAVCDVRSSPFSRLNPQFNQEALQRALKAAGISYGFLGKQLGARPVDPSYYVDGRASYALMAAGPAFQDGIRRLRQGMEQHRVALLCAEKDPLTCHRTILVCRNLRGLGLGIDHILEDASLESHAEAELRLLDMVRLERCNLFEDTAALVERAYDLQGQKIAYRPAEASADEEQ